VLLNILADEIHRAHQRCLFEAECDPNKVRLPVAELLGFWRWLGSKCGEVWFRQSIRGCQELVKHTCRQGVRPARFGKLVFACGKVLED